MKKLLYYYFAMHTLYCIALLGTRPIVSLFVYETGGSEALIGILVSLYALLPMLLAIRIGKWLDRFGARSVTLWGGAGMLLAIALPSLLANIPTLFFSQLMMGFSQICVLISLQKTVGNLPGDRDRLFATFSLSGSTGELIGPLMSGFLYERFGFSVSFAASAACIAIALLMGLLISRSAWRSGEPLERQEQPGAIASNNTWGLLRTANLRNALIISGLVLYSKDLFVAYFPIYATNLGMSSGRIGIILSLMAAMSILVRVTQFYLVRRFGRGRLLFVTLLLSAAAYLLIPLSEWPILLTVLAMALGVGLGLGQPLSLVFALNSSPSGRQGEVLGMRLTFNRASQFGAPILFGVIGSAAGVSPIFWLSGGVLLFGAFFTRIK
ncbi:MFS transporter [Paenibacillus abyssi]|uniref:MFS transporter n=1 Tax=Paenibacillus abyssi TaxID=1340531 RepID=A0A917FTV6_9BACL|nr:MFS transporter [Paenibacillus abyssi]GGG01192.1 MFS transporter [Paenibacillus abyssi]